MGVGSDGFFVAFHRGSHFSGRLPCVSHTSSIRDMFSACRSSKTLLNGQRLFAFKCKAFSSFNPKNNVEGDAGNKACRCKTSDQPPSSNLNSPNTKIQSGWDTWRALRPLIIQALFKAPTSTVRRINLDDDKSTNQTSVSVFSLKHYWKPWLRIAVAFSLMLAGKVANVQVPLIFKELVEKFRLLPALSTPEGTVWVVAGGLLGSYAAVRFGAFFMNEMKNFLVSRLSLGTQQHVQLFTIFATFYKRRMFPCLKPFVFFGFSV